MAREDLSIKETSGSINPAATVSKLPFNTRREPET